MHGAGDPAVLSDKRHKPGLGCVMRGEHDRESNSTEDRSAVKQSHDESFTE